MPRPKKSHPSQGKNNEAQGTVASTKQSDGLYLAQNENSSRDSVGVAVPGRRDANVAFWKSLGFTNARSTCKRSKVQNLKVIAPQKHQVNSSIKERYKLYSNPSKKRVLLLQYPNRQGNQLYCDDNGQKPLEIRIKPKSGLVEVDAPINVDDSFDQERGLDFGDALRKSRDLPRHGAQGLGGGLGIDPIRNVKGGTETAESPAKARLMENFKDSNNKGYVMNKITLGGRIIAFREGDPIYAIATFESDICTWTKVDAIVQLRPQFNHLDAVNDITKMLRTERTSEGRNREDRAEDVNLVLKETPDNDNFDMYGGMNETARLLRLMRDEPWQRLQWIDERNEVSYEHYEEALVHEETGKGQRLVSEMTHEQYLDAISCPRTDPIAEGRGIMQSLEADADSSDDEEAEQDGESEAHRLADSDATERGQLYETFPDDLVQPNGGVEQDVERICRIVTMTPSHMQNTLEKSILKSRPPRFAFLDAKNEFHSYYRWRLQRNQLGEGVNPKDDDGLRSE